VGWEWSSIQQTAETVFGQSPPSSSYNSRGEGLPFFQGKAEFGERHPSAEKWCTKPTREAIPGDILISIRAPVGPTNVANQVCAIGRGLAAIRPLIDPEYVRFWLKRSEQELAQKGTGTTFSAISKNVLNTHLLPVAPLNEQRRIVEKIETLFARLGQGEAALRHTQTLLARYRQSVLKAAVTGALTADWRAANAHRLEHGRDLLARILQTRRETWQGRGKYQEPAAPDTSNLPELPEGWVWASVDQLSHNHDGRRILLKRSERDKRGGRYPYYGAQGIIDDIDDYLFDGLYLLVAEDGANLLSRVKPLALQAHGKFWVNNHAHVLEIIPGSSLDFVELAINSLDISLSVTGTAQPKLTQAALNRLAVPLPGEAEQSRICELVQEAFARGKRVGEWCQTELTRSAALRQSILKDAFAGKLVPQDPSDEPAAELLARIRASRATPSGRVGKAQRAHAEPTTDDR
jgi:type I restriction enzyme S subunit